MRLSIIVTNYNYGRFLEQALTSIYQNRAHDQYEVLLVDDGSTDESRKIIKSLGVRFPTLRIFYHDQNLGQEAAFETAYPHLRGEYLHPFAADDIMLPHTIDKMLEYFEHFPSVPAFCSDNAFFSIANPKPLLEIAKLLDTSEFHFFPPESVCRLFYETSFWVPGHTLFAKREIYLKYTPFDKNLRFINDWWVNHRLALHEGIAYIPGALSAQRKHPSSFSAAPSLESRKAVWLYLLSLIEKEPAKYRALYRSGIFRMFGVRAIYKELLCKPKYWKYLWPICRRMAHEYVNKR